MWVLIEKNKEYVLYKCRGKIGDTYRYIKKLRHLQICEPPALLKSEVWQDTGTLVVVRTGQRIAFGIMYALGISNTPHHSSKGWMPGIT